LHRRSNPRFDEVVDRSTTRQLLAVALVGYGIYRALYVPPLLIGPPAPLLVIGFLVQAVAGIIAGVGVWRGAPWASVAIIVLFLSIAFTAFVEAFVLGIKAYLRALLEVVVAAIVAVLLTRSAAAPRGAVG
jgi:hypothetical protein